MNRRTFNLIVGWAALALMACQENGNTFDATGTFETEEVTVAAKATGELLQFDVVEKFTAKAVRFGPIFPTMIQREA